MIGLIATFHDGKHMKALFWKNSNLIIFQGLFLSTPVSASAFAYILNNREANRVETTFS